MLDPSVDAPFWTSKLVHASIKLAKIANTTTTKIKICRAMIRTLLVIASLPVKEMLNTNES